VRKANPAGVPRGLFAVHEPLGIWLSVDRATVRPCDRAVGEEVVDPTPGHEIGRRELPGSVGVTNGRRGEVGAGNEAGCAPRRRDLRALAGDTGASRDRHCPPPRFGMQVSAEPGRGCTARVVGASNH